MLANTKYYGKSIIYKTHVPEYKATRKINDGEVNRYASEGNGTAPGKVDTAKWTPFSLLPKK